MNVRRVSSATLQAMALVAVAAPITASAAVGQGEQLAGVPDDSVPLLTLLAVLAVTALIALLIGDDDDEEPDSP